MLIIYMCAFILFIAFSIVSMLSLIIGGEALIENPTNTKAWVLASAGLIGLILYVSIDFYITPDISYITSFNNT